MNKPQFDTIIIGQGLAGSILAHTLIGRGQGVMVIDNAHKRSSSKVAAGIINPITGHRLNISDRFEHYFPVAKTYYQTLETELDTPLFKLIKQQRLIKTQGQLDYFHQRCGEATYKEILDKEILDNKFCRSDFFLNPEFGVANIKQTAVVDTKHLLSSTQKWLVENNAYQQGKVDYQQIHSLQNGVEVNTLSARRVIFCEGYQAIHNPWLEHLPFKLAKGEILTLQAKQEIDQLLNWGSWVAPQVSGSTVKLGSNFIWNDLTTATSMETKSMLLEQLASKTTLDVEVTNHKAGIRPTTTRRRPFVGKLSSLENAYCFNGFGSKGCLLIPYYADLLANHIISRSILPKDITQWL